MKVKKHKYKFGVFLGVVFCALLGFRLLSGKSTSAYTSAANPVDPSVASDDYVVNFPDEQLRNIIKYKLGVSNDSEITYGRLKTFKEFSISIRGESYTYVPAWFIENIEGVQFLTSVTNMDLGGGAQFTDITPLRDMHNLKVLNFLDSDYFSNLEPLKNLSNLESLSLGNDNGRNTNEYDLSLLGGLKNLKKLELANLASDWNNRENTKKDIDFIGGLHNLTELNLEGIDPKSYEPLRNLNKIEILNMSNAYYPPTLDFLSSFQNLRVLNLSRGVFLDNGGNPVSNLLHDLNSLPSGIEELDISYNRSFSIFMNSGLERLTRLKKIKVDRFDTDEQFNVLMNFPELTDLTFSTVEYGSGGIYAFSNLDKLTTLKSLTINGRYDDIEGLASLKNLENLSFIVGDQVSDISAISGLSNLKSLTIGGRGVDISPIANLSNLKYLNMNISEVRGEEAVNSLSNLEELEFNSMSNLHIKDLSMISKLSNLRKIVTSGMSSYGNPGAISDITGLSGKDNLEHIEIQVNNVSNMPTLSNPQNLKVLDLSYNPVVVSSGVLANMTNLEYLSVDVEDYSFVAGMNKMLLFNASGENITDFSALGKLSPISTIYISRNIFQSSMATSVNRPFFKNPFRNIDGSYLKIPNTDTVKTVNANGELDPSGEYILLSNINDGDKGSTVVQNIYMVIIHL